MIHWFEELGDEICNLLMDIFKPESVAVLIVLIGFLTMVGLILWVIF